MNLSPVFVCIGILIMLTVDVIASEPTTYETPSFLATIDEDWSFKSFAGMIKNSINIEIPWDLIKSVLEGPIETQVLIETVIQEQISFLIPAVLGLLAAIFVPLITIIFCCCRCCGNCGSNLTTRDVKKQRNVDLICNGIVVLAAVGIVFSAAACVPTSGTRVKNSPKIVVDSLQHGAHDIPIFVSYLVEDSKEVVSDHLNDTIDSIKVLLQDLPNVLSEPLLNSTKDYITYIENDVQQIIQAVDSLSTVETETNDTVDSILKHVSDLELTLNDMNTNLTTIKNKCTTDGELFCDQLPTGSGDPVSYDVGPLTDLVAAITELVDVTKDVNLTGYLSMGNDTFATIPRIISNASKDGIKDIMEALDSVPDTVLPAVYETLDTVGNMTNNLGLDEALDNVDADIESLDATIDPIFNMAMKAVGAYIGMIGGLALIGVIMGCACRGRSSGTNYGRNKMTACGATCLMCSVFLAASSILIVLLLGSLFLIVGGNLTITCKTIEDVSIVEKLIENEILFGGDNLGKIILDNENISISVQAFMQNCRDGGTLFSSFNVSEMVDLNDMFNASSFVPSLDDGMYDSINETIQNITVFDTDFLNNISSQLALPENSSTDNIQDLKDSVAEVDLLEMSKNFTKLADTLTVEWYSNYYRTMAQRLTYAHQHTKMPLQEAINGLELNLNDLNATGVNIQNAIVYLNSTLSALQDFIQTEAVTVMFQSIDDFLTSMLTVPDEFINNILKTLSNDVGECQIIGDMYDSITGSFCVYFLDSFNALWAALYSAGMVFIFLMIASCKLGNYFRRPQPRNNMNANAKDIRIRIEHLHRQSTRDNNNNAQIFQASSKVQMMKNFLTRKRGVFQTGADSPQLLRIMKLSENLKVSRESRDMMLYQNPLHLYQSIELRSETPEDSPETVRSVNVDRTDDQQPASSESENVHINVCNQENSLEGKTTFQYQNDHDSALLDLSVQAVDFNENALENQEYTESKVPAISTATLCGSFQDLHPSDLEDGLVNMSYRLDIADSEPFEETSILVGVTGSEREQYLDASILTPSTKEIKSTVSSKKNNNNPVQLLYNNTKITCSLCKNTNGDSIVLNRANQYTCESSSIELCCPESGQHNATVDGKDPAMQDVCMPIQYMSNHLEANLNDFEDIYSNLLLEKSHVAESEKHSGANRSSTSKVNVNNNGRTYPRNSGKVLDIKVRPYTEKLRLEALEMKEKTEDPNKSLGQDSQLKSPGQLNMQDYIITPDSMNNTLPSQNEELNKSDDSFYHQQITEISADLGRSIVAKENDEKREVKSLIVLSSEALIEGAMSSVIPHKPIQRYRHASTSKQNSRVTYM